MAAQGTTTIDFGAFPGSPDASVTVTGQGSITATSLVEAWIMPTATADHSADEHWADPPRVMAGTIVNGTGFTIYGTNRSERLLNVSRNGRGQVPTYKEDMPYGQWTVAWAWN
jgi:hypothetical protein